MVEAESHFMPLDAEVVIDKIQSLGKVVLTFAGFGELGYEDEERVREICSAELDRFHPRDTIVNTGTLITEGFRRGIALVYPLARARGFATAGVHPSVALTHPKRHRVSQGVDHIFFVDDPTWGGVLANGNVSDTLRVLLEVTDALAVIGGGQHTAQELQAFLGASKPVRFYSASMHRETALRWSAESGVAIDDFRGAAESVWSTEIETPKADL